MQKPTGSDRQLNDKARTPYQVPGRTRLWLRLGVLALAGLATTAQTSPAGENSGIVSLEKEALIGARVAEDVRNHGSAIDSAAAQDFVQQLGRNLAAQLPASGLAYTFELVAHGDSPMHEPAVTPGGHIFVPAPLFLSAESESEFAGMLAHSMVHAAERHTVRLAPRGPITTLSDIPMLVVIHRGDRTVPLRYVNPLREFELQADRLAMQAMARAGYEPAALFRYVNRVQGEEAQGPNSTIPPREARISNLQQALAGLSPSTYSSNSGEFERVRLEMRALLDRIPPRPSLP